MESVIELGQCDKGIEYGEIQNDLQEEVPSAVVGATEAREDRQKGDQRTHHAVLESAKLAIPMKRSIAMER